jgi:signal transduction histidine kinase
MAGTIRTSALALDRLVDRFLDYTQLAVQASAPGQRTGGNPGDSAVLERAARGAAERHARSGDLRLHLSPSAPRMPGAQLGRLVDELVDNACKFSAPGSPVDLVATVRAGRFVLEVRDAGRGMTAEQIADVGALMQFDRARYEQPGAGLGLAIARLLAETNEGSLSLESAPGRGCAVIVSLPRPVGA